MPQATEHEPFYWWVDKSKIVSEEIWAILVLFWPFFGLNFKFGRYMCHQNLFWLPIPPTFALSQSTKITTGKLLCTSHHSLWLFEFFRWCSTPMLFIAISCQFRFFDVMVVKSILPLRKMLNTQMMQIMYKQ